LIKLATYSRTAPQLVDQTGLDIGEVATLSLALERQIVDVLIDQ